MLNKVKIQNFKSIGEPGIELELKPLTFLVGPNGAGKSSTLEAIGVAAQRGTGGGILSLPNSEAAIHKRKSSQSVAQTIVDLYFSDRPNVLSGLGFRFRLVKEENGQVSQSEYRLQNDLPVSDSNTSATITKMLNELASQTYLVSATRGNVPYTSDTLGAINVNAVGRHGENILFVL
ncbi:MAG: ATP-binding protein, partial [Chloroflexi bacterium]|nr:ATP-binding protein [Chloroflexota bacterium]